MKINWKVRLRNPAFWMTIIPALVACVYSILGACGVVPVIAEDAVTGVIGTVVTGLAMLGVLIDPTTAGMSDSERAMNYERPAGDRHDGD